MLDNPAVNVITNIPAVWDEPIVLPESRIGELSIFARRKGTMWMLAVMCGPDPRSIQVPLYFLGSGQYQAALVRDSADGPAAVQLEQKALSSGDSLTINMRPGGGFVAQFKKQ